MTTLVAAPNPFAICHSMCVTVHIIAATCMRHLYVENWKLLGFCGIHCVDFTKKGLFKHSDDIKFVSRQLKSEGKRKEFRS